MSAEPTDEASEYDTPWRALIRRLASYLGTMRDPSDELHLMLPDGAMATVQVTDGRFHWQLDDQGGARPLSLMDGWPSVEGLERYAADLVMRIQQLHDVAGPELITYDANGPAGAGAAILQLPAWKPPMGPCLVFPDAPEVETIRGHAHLQKVLLDHLRTTYDPDVEFDDDGDIAVDVEGVSCYVRIVPGRPILRVWRPVIGNIRSRRQADAELTVLNRSTDASRWVRLDRSIQQRLTIAVPHYVWATVDAGLQLFAEEARGSTADLRDRLGGTVGW